MNPPADDSHLIEQGTGSTLLHKGFLELRRDTVRLPDGSSATREYVRHSGAVAVVPLLDEGPNPRIVMVRQYRYPVAKVLLEFPAGKIDPGEAQIACAVRELKEETGYSAAEWAYGGEIHNASAYSDESIWIWFARGLTPGATNPDAEEFVETVVLTLEELVQRSISAQLPDVKTQIGLSWLQHAFAGRMVLPWQSAAAAGAL